MFRHMVCFKFKEDATEEQIQSAVAALKAVKEEVPQIRSFTMGPNVNQSRRPKRYNWVMAMDFDNPADHQIYEHSDAHRRVVDQNLVPIVEHLTSIDYDLELNRA